MVLKTVKNENYLLLVDKVKLDIDQGLIIQKLKCKKPENFFLNEDNKLWYFSSYAKDYKLINLLNPDKKILSINFKNDDYNDYRKENLIINLDPRYLCEFKTPENYEILKTGDALLIKEGKFSGQYRNMYWKVRDDNDNIYYLMHIKDEIYTKISKKDINKVLNVYNVRPGWYLNNNGYIGTTIRIDDKIYNIYLHQLIMDVHDEDLTNYERTVDHINQDKLDNRSENLRLVNMSVQNANRDKASRRCDAYELPAGLTQKDLPKYVSYRKEILDKETGKYREFFIIDGHPKINKPWETTKSMKVEILEKLKLAKLKLQLLDELITEKQYNKETGCDKTIELPQSIRLSNKNNKYNLIYDYRNTKSGERIVCNMVLKSTDLQKELNIFIDNINKKYPTLNIPSYQIKNLPKIKLEDVSPEKERETPKLTLPPNTSFYCERGKYYLFEFNKIIDKKRHCMKYTIKSNDIQKEFNTFIEALNKKYPEINYPNYIIPNCEGIKLI